MLNYNMANCFLKIKLICENLRNYLRTSARTVFSGSNRDKLCSKDINSKGFTQIYTEIKRRKAQI